MDKKSSLAALEKALGELHSYENAIKAGTFPGKSLEDAAKLLKFLKDNYKTLQTQYSQLQQEIIAESKSEAEKVAKAKDVTNNESGEF
jgi:uncharacterized membrane-anchored protein YhcB (DUF1043 family)